MNRVVTVLALCALVAGDAGAVQTGTGVPPGQAMQPSQQRGNRQQPPATRMEAEQRLREAIARNIRSNMELPDSLVERLSSLAFRYRDSSIVLNDREAYIRSQMRAEAGASRLGRVPNEARLGCLVDQFYVTLREHINLRSAEDREASQFLNPLRRYRYLSLQDRLYEIIDDAVGNMNRRFGDRKSVV